MPNFDPMLDGLPRVWAVIRAPGRGRGRFPENCVQEMPSAAAALDAAGPGCRPAQVCGPSRSSEGFRLYYLVRWLDGDD